MTDGTLKNDIRSLLKEQKAAVALMTAMDETLASIEPRVLQYIETAWKSAQQKTKLRILGGFRGATRLKPMPLEEEPPAPSPDPVEEVPSP